MPLAHRLALLLTLSSTAVLAHEPPWAREDSLRKRMLLERTAVCTDGKGHYVSSTEVFDSSQPQLFYGDGATFTEIPIAPNVVRLPTGSYFEPRFWNPDLESNANGVDARAYSVVQVDPKEGTCSVRCGQRATAFKLLATETSRELLRKAAYTPSPMKYEPYALLRDTKGVYFLVERGRLQAEQKSFRVFIGPRGRMKQQQMVNVVSDSKGEIFSTKKGDLQLLLDRELPSLWVEKKARRKLRQVPVSENLALIYNELGIYTGARLGTPCDDL
ncbi:hypothetical protein [Myxococcus sp. CA040A]|uniref:hypothetical protein n=1 Tax=Myxococcus sp. CA040A TaxID=2741738 RepID=UPI00157AF03A|nr:hypothetical protein [Myxococcus sp. CA040A]NTX06299.1 hypothetical protein [Myxococcus sp. CA040A]